MFLTISFIISFLGYLCFYWYMKTSDETTTIGDFLFVSGFLLVPILNIILTFLILNEIFKINDWLNKPLNIKKINKNEKTDSN